MHNLAVFNGAVLALNRGLVPLHFLVLLVGLQLVLLLLLLLVSLVFDTATNVNDAFVFRACSLACD
jgi:hypothetical protein